MYCSLCNWSWKQSLPTPHFDESLILCHLLSEKQKGLSLTGGHQGLGGFRLTHTLLTQNSQTGEEERKPQGEENIFEVTLRTLWSCSLVQKQRWACAVCLELALQFYLWWLCIQDCTCTALNPAMSPSRETLMFKELKLFVKSTLLLWRNRSRWIFKKKCGC